MAKCLRCLYSTLPNTAEPCSLCENASRFVESAPLEKILTESNSASNLAVDPKPKTTSDPVNHPAHYTSSGGIDCSDALEAMVQGYTDVQDGSEAWQVVKYVWRAPLKGRPLEDLKKARWYLDRIIGRLEHAGQAD